MEDEHIEELVTTGEFVGEDNVEFEGIEQKQGHDEDFADNGGMEEEYTGNEVMVEEQTSDQWVQHLNDGLNLPLDEDGATAIDDRFGINALQDISMIEFMNLRREEVLRFHFSDVAAAFEFYNMYAKARGFSGRKSKTRKIDGELLWQNFVCHREGYRPEKYYHIVNRNKKPRAETKCGCKAMMQVYVVPDSGRLVVALFEDQHNHPTLDPRFMGMLPAHRKMGEAEIGQMTDMRNGGISTTHIYGCLASLSGGYQNLSFRVRDMHNEVAKQRQLVGGDADSAMPYR